MNKRKYDHSKTNKRIKQRARTKENQINKYETLLLERPNDPQAKVWERKLNSLK